ncbi:MAG: hypothetical protein EHM45_19820 [Desulfobacteraceae bacterium]|nr:MAG: hypothetical protein EHM45_19820 [Desulfobacteraceae bacterium]
MPKKHLLQLFIVAVFILMGATLVQSVHQSPRITLKEVLSIGSIEDDLLFQWTGVTTDPEGNIYLTDLKDCSIKKFDKSGLLLKKEGKKGQGPGEFDSPVLIKYQLDKVYVSQIYKSGILVFDKNLKYIFTIPLTFPVSDFEVRNDDEILVNMLFPQNGNNSSSILVLDAHSVIRKEIPYDKRDSKRFDMNSIKFASDQNQNIILIYNWKDRVMKMSKTGKLLFDKKLLNISKPLMEKTTYGEIPRDIIYKAVQVDTKGNIYILGGHRSKNVSRDIYILSKEGKLIDILTLPEASHMIYIDRDDCLYSRSNEGVTLKKYKIQYE